MIEKCKASTGQLAWSDPPRCRFNATKDGWCTIHHPDNVKARREKRAERIQKQTAMELASTVAVGLINAKDDQLIAEVKRRGLLARASA